MSQLYQCPHCQTLLATEESVGGVLVDCPQCGKEFVARPMEQTKHPVGFTEAWKRKWTRWYWRGRASRSEFWWGVLAQVLESLGLSLFIPVLGSATLLGLWSLASFFPSTCQYVRRLHDAGHSGKWVIAEYCIVLLLYVAEEALVHEAILMVLLLLFAIIEIITLVFTLQASKQGDNKYGGQPDL